MRNPSLTPYFFLIIISLLHATTDPISNFLSTMPKRLLRRNRKWRGETSDRSARAYRRRAEALAKEGYGEFRIPIMIPRAGARGTSLRLHGWLERNGWIYSIRKGAGGSVLAFEFF